MWYLYADEPQVEAKLESGDGFALATLNLDHLVKLSESHSFREAYLAQDMIVADGNPVVWLSRLALRPVKLVPGSELVVPLARLAASADIKVALIGSTVETLKKSALVLQEQAPGLSIVAQVAPPFGFDPESDEAGEILADLENLGARLCFLALGAPKQEIFAARGRKASAAVGFVSVGAGLDFLAGSQNRAPAWVRRLALEWLWRLASSPRRLIPRYLRCAGILPRLVIDALRLRHN